MKRNIFRIVKELLFVFTLSVCIFMTTSCNSELKVELKKDGTLAFQFSGEFGDGLEKLVSSISDDDEIFDTKTINYELIKSGFSDVNVFTKGKRSLTISMTEKGQNSYLFTSGIVNTQKQKLTINLSPKTLSKFYSLCDEQIVLYLDLLLAPIFNDEKMSESEYLETIASFYGQSVADEFEKSNVRITIATPDGKSKISNLSIAKLLTLNESLVLE